MKSVITTAAALAGFFLADSIHAQLVDGDNKILYPSATGLTFNYLDTVDVALTTDYTTPYLYLFCWDDNDALQNIVYYTPAAGTSVTAVQLQSDTEYTGTTCWFNLLDAESGSNTTAGATSPEFTYVKQEGSDATYSLSGLTASTSAASSASTAIATTTKTTSASVSSKITGTAYSTATAVSSSNSTVTYTTPASTSVAVVTTSVAGMSTKMNAGTSLLFSVVGLGLISLGLF
ncbi:hypothetical protein BX600DRAFT_513949 [Xylariales sp. PMI_506]|nr:hypothetical protein BX600DRAFT_513949 [Xylariales sp. PMI_506]